MIWGKEGKAEVDYAEGKVYIKYIDRDPAVIARQKKVEKVLKLEAKDRMRAEQRAEEQRKRAMESAKPAAPKAVKDKFTMTFQWVWIPPCSFWG